MGADSFNISLEIPVLGMTCGKLLLNLQDDQLLVQVQLGNLGALDFAAEEALSSRSSQIYLLTSLLITPFSAFGNTKLTNEGQDYIIY